MSVNLFIRVGTSIIEMKRIRKASRNPKFLAKYFSADEIRYLVAHKLSTELIAENSVSYTHLTLPTNSRV